LCAAIAPTPRSALPAGTRAYSPGRAVARGGTPIIAADALAVLRLPAVRHLWLAGVGAGVMRWLEVLAFGLYALDATGSPLAVALTSFARFLPLLLLGAPAGALAERMEPGRLLVAAYLALAAAEALAGGAALLGGLRLWQVLLLAFVAGVFWCVEIPVRRTFMAEASGAEHATLTMGLEMLTTHLIPAG